MTNRFTHPILVTKPLLPDLDKVNKRLSEIWETAWVTNNGPQKQALKQKLTDYLEAENCSLFSNGTLALLLGLKALNLTGEVITTPFTFPATVQALDWNGLTPVFCDIEPDTLTIDVSKIEALITEKTSAILGVHVFGNPCDVEKIQEIADRYHLKVIYDAAHAFGAKIKGKPVSQFGDMTMFSFHATKLFNTIEGGALTFSNPQLVRELDLLKNFGIINQGEVELSGLNAKMNEIQAAIGLETLKMVEQERSKRHLVKKAYEQYLSGIPGIRILTSLEEDCSSYQYFVIEINEKLFGDSRDRLFLQLEKNNVFPRKYFHPLCSDFAWYKDNKSAQPQNLPQAQKTVNEVLSMPYYGDLRKSDVEGICNILKELQKKKVGAAL